MISVKILADSVYLSHALDHMRLHLAGDTSEDHIAHATWNLFTLMWTQENKPELLDLNKLPQVL